MKLHTPMADQVTFIINNTPEDYTEAWDGVIEQWILDQVGIDDTEGIEFEYGFSGHDTDGVMIEQFDDEAYYDIESGFDIDWDAIRNSLPW